MSKEAEDINTSNATLLAYTSKVPIGLLYNKYVDDKKYQTWGLVTTADGLTPDANKPADVPGCYVFWDFVTNDWIIVGHDNVTTWTIEHLDTLKHLSDDGTECPSPTVLLRLSAEDTARYCETLISETTNIVNNIDDTIESKKINLSKDERLDVLSACFKNKPNGAPASHGLQPNDLSDVVSAPRGDASLNDVLNVFRDYDLKACNYYLILECCVDIDTIINDTATEEEMSVARDKWMNYIRKHRLIAFEELDELEEEARKEGSTIEDLQDIDTIKQMFRDIPQDTDLTQYKTLEDLTNFWPSLLLPKPPVEKPTKNTQLSPEEELASILKDVNSIEDLQNILDEVNHPESEVPGYAVEMLTSRISELKSS